MLTNPPDLGGSARTLGRRGAGTLYLSRFLTKQVYLLGALWIWIYCE